MQSGYVYVWEYIVKAESAAEFERVYGPSGDWVELFRRSEGYVGTQLHRDRSRSGRYLTVDYWRSRDDFSSFREDFASEFDALDQRCQALTQEERFVGEFTPVGSTEL